MPAAAEASVPKSKPSNTLVTASFMALGSAAEPPASFMAADAAAATGERGDGGGRGFVLDGFGSRSCHKPRVRGVPTVVACRGATLPEPPAQHCLKQADPSSLAKTWSGYSFGLPGQGKLRVHPHSHFPFALSAVPADSTQSLCRESRSPFSKGRGSLAGERGSLAGWPEALPSSEAINAARMPTRPPTDTSKSRDESCD